MFTARSVTTLRPPFGGAGTQVNQYLFDEYRSFERRRKSPLA
jgi:hypothetical protein